MKFKTLTFLLFVVTAAFAQQTELDRMNNSTPLFPGCTKSEAKYDYFVQSVGAIVLDSVNAHNKLHPVADDRLEIRVMLSTPESGQIDVRTVVSANKTVEAIAKASLQKLPRVVPIYRTDGTPASCSVGFVLVLQKDKSTGMFVHEYKSKLEEWQAKPNSMPIAIIDAAFPGCTDSKRFGSCFEEKFSDWLLPKLSTTAVAEFKNIWQVIRITVNEGGALHSYELFSASDSLKKEVDAIMKSFPNVTPSTIDESPYMATYVFPMLVK